MKDTHFLATAERLEWDYSILTITGGKEMKNELYFNDKKTFGDVVSNIWHTITGDKILAGMSLITLLSVFGVITDQRYSLKLDDKSIDLHPDDTAS